jgi:hypothetical protein
MHSGFDPRLRIAPLLAACAVVTAATVSYAHKAPTGWTYPKACCSNQDCRQVSHDAVTERPEGYVIGETGEILPYSDSRLKDSPDGEFHWCAVGDADFAWTICLFVPPRSF